MAADQAAETFARAGRDCILFLSHHIRPGAMAALAKLIDDCRGRLDVFPVFDQTHGVFPVDAALSRALVVDAPALEAALSYPAKNAQHPGTLWPRNIDLPLLSFYRSHPAYRRYWVVEYDVRYSGHWRDFFAAFADNDSDLLAMTMFDFAFRPGWAHWGSFRSTPEVAMADRVRATLSFYRLSARALVAIDRAYQNGAAGHYEVAIPTIVKQAGLTLEDMGGDGAYVAAGNLNRFYTNSPGTPGLAPGTFVLHAEGMVKDALPDMLWNPFKD